MLGEFSEEMDQTGSRMDSVLKKMEKVSHMTSSKCSSLYCVFLIGHYHSVGQQLKTY